MPGLCQSNELIARDEALHTVFALTLYTMLRDECKLSREHICGIFADGVAIADEFANYIIPTNNLSGMNASLMQEYTRNIADNMLAIIDEPPEYKVKHSFAFMDKISMVQKTSFFEARVSQYSKPSIEENGEFIAADF